MAAMQLSVLFGDNVVTVHVGRDTDVLTLKAILEAETGVTSHNQALVFGNRLLDDSQTLSAAGVKDGDLILMGPAQAPAAQQGGQQHQQRQQDRRRAQNPDGSATSPAAFVQAFKDNMVELAQLQQHAPELYKAIVDEDLVRMQDLLRAMHKNRSEHHAAEAAAAREEQLLNERLANDPMDIDAQRRLEEMIQQKNIEENFNLAMEHNPEVFAQVAMLYVNLEVNGVYVKAFVDSGAQMTIMTSSFVEKCFLARLIDKRFKGMAVGVGSSPITGRVHQAPLKVNGHYFTCSITVLEQKGGPQFILGLDMLRRHQCCIDLNRGVLRIGSVGVDLPFLSESQIPVNVEDQIEEVPEDKAKESMSRPGAAGSGSAAAAAPPAAPLAAPAAPPVQRPPTAQIPAGVQALVDLGFPQAQAIQALEAAGGNVVAAAAMLFGGAD